MGKSVIVYQKQTPCYGPPPIFRDDRDAWTWAVGQGAYQTLEDAAAAYATVARRHPSAPWSYWLAHVANIVGNLPRGE